MQGRNTFFPHTVNPSQGSLGFLSSMFLPVRPDMVVVGAIAAIGRINVIAETG
jgi:membrane protein YqaA with SNARE-associated domain